MFVRWKRKKKQARMRCFDKETKQICVHVL
jgi:hypothetical protein